ncbi:deoxyribose-phosphate aldolase [Diplocloster agilis]|uniref:Deoxyribose-phosphate aldolase n=1 Tax=Diplocloster agilis TaxID=2850323 RepID=A0A949K3L4_9FIRM|nr:MULTISPECIES: deoxyribose-phosphate aldolase [Lachnospiraceae]MBU9739149.1 deoxyribose-phosphate aldolase [Diplocloster agilis]MBU9746774.1 deoxyribose-phosphate aldolase [Diplocloster agilis]MCU6735722.1 deoxyribose-phosphate aldolase [Suonthocola fibrivorans]SCJ80411.1 Deoxyribose-phosphate aldolase 1 [uncultured Clostridium sp.]
MNTNIASYVDHTILKPQATTEDVRKLCEEAKKYSFASVCINPKHVSFAYDILKDTTVQVCTVIGFPLGANTSEIKALEAKKAVEDGAGEVDMVIDIGAAKEHDYARVKEDVAAVRAAAKSPTILKVIIETCLLTDEEKVEVCKVCKEAGADFVKTSTGFSTGGATVEDVALMYKTVAPEVKVKASGGIRNKEDADAMIKAGASRLGTSAGIKIVEG